MTARREPVTHFADVEALIGFLRSTAGRPMEEPGLHELDHGLQCAEELRMSDPEDEELQLAGLVHDVCHGQCSIAIHQEVGAEAVRQVLGDRVAALVGLHVDAKRYLVATDASYSGALSRVSTHTLQLQGGAMTPDEVAAFEASPYAQDAVKLRKADEAAKTPGRIVPGLEAWEAALRRLAAARSR